MIFSEKKSFPIHPFFVFNCYSIKTINTAMSKKQFYIAELIARHLSGLLSADEEAGLKAWRESAPEHERLFREICSAGNIVKYGMTANRFDKNKGWERLCRKLRSARRRSFYFRLSRYAAILIIPIIVDLTIIYLHSSGEEPETASVSNFQETVIRPGEKKAVLTLGNGEKVDLHSFTEKILEEEDGTAIAINEDALHYQRAQQHPARTPDMRNQTAQNQSARTDTAEEKELFHRIDVPPGGEYALTLSDGTKIYLNSVSSLKFPVRFVSDQRTVELEGEGYFEVAKSDKPFFVRTGTLEVEILGTTFNISAYPGESSRTTLVEGSLKVSMQSGASCILKPSEQASTTDEAGTLDVRKVDVLQYTSWISGKIYFKDTRLEDMMNKLARWYDVTVSYRSQDIKNIRFGCNVNRYDNISPFLELLEKTGKVRIETEGKNVIFKPYKKLKTEKE
jgi:ferric-dicitrate binding protein FerR (iron transport regulator)